mmetsp:Transcript_61233/g.138580  ORF Transcript_61233/g.138580 Transcript_61233/m.138580 type:complete len:293 (+) Transcript_61233:115-993(+)|eukprot:CAMPEP_0172586996 /NCGR_PEP_ID=MMETSP1068-20121228/6169_1 /TAXON_ID=35684 /ORGANISM="Pseudopedinella elastica, Strain CCMP716" /LENGTH=292 /DNA_ID=CAMNT_0013381897 /DNA_START=80 /DNA_END=958 /DNA_ORIENTATION=-
MSTNPINGKIFYIGAARLSDKIIVANVSYNGKEIDNTPVRQMLISMTEITSRKLYAFSLGSYSWGVMEVDGLCYVVATAVDYPTRVMAKCLQDTAKLFVTRVQETWKTCKEDGLSDTSRKTLLQLCERYDDLAEQDKLAKTMAKVDEVKVQMEANISQALENCVQLEKLENDSADLQASAHVFKKEAEKLKDKMWWKNCKMKLLIASMIIGVLGVIALIIAVQVGAFEETDDNGGSDDKGKSPTATCAVSTSTSVDGNVSTTTNTDCSKTITTKDANGGTTTTIEPAPSRRW